MTMRYAIGASRLGILGCSFVRRGRRPHSSGVALILHVHVNHVNARHVKRSVVDNQTVGWCTRVDARDERNDARQRLTRVSAIDSFRLEKRVDARDLASRRVGRIGRFGRGDDDGDGDGEMDARWKAVLERV
jgi:hypothetical protein